MEILESQTGSVDIVFAMNQWAQKLNLGFEFSGLSDVYHQAKKLDIEPDIAIRPDFGVIDSYLWNHLVTSSTQKLPLVDPHDVIGHAPSMLSPKVRTMFKKGGLFTLKLIEELENKDSSIDKQSLQILLDIYRGPIRLMTYENLAFLSTSKSGKNSLVLTGNRAKPILSAVYEPLSRYFPELVMGTSSGKVDFSKLQFWEEFKNQNHQEYQKFEKLYKIYGGSGDPFQVEAKLLKLYDKHIPKVRNSTDTKKSVLDFFDGFAKDIAVDEALEKVFDLDNRLDLWDSSLELLEKYFVFLSQRK